MKRMLIACLAGLAALALAVPASAIHLGGPEIGTGEGIDFQARGSFKALGGWSDNADFSDKGQEEDEFVAGQRARVYFELAASKNVKYVLGTEIGETVWGGDKGGAIDTDGENIEVKHSYLDFNLANFNVKAGLQGVALPSHYGSNILNTDVAGITASTQVNDMLSLTAGWLRPNDASTPDNQHVNGTDEWDAAFLAAPITMDNVNFTPFFVYSWLGKESATADNILDLVNMPDSNFGEVALEGDNAGIYWAGFSGDVNLDPITIMADLNYGSMDADKEEQDVKGWFGYLEADYAMDMATPAIFGFYGSGNDDDKDDGLEIMPKISPDYWAAGSTFLFDGDTLFPGFQDSDLLDQANGLMGFGFKLKDIQFMDKLTHDFNFVWVQGTNDKKTVKSDYTPKIQYMTEEDSAMAVEFNSAYALYDNLTALVELGYINPDFDSDVYDNADDYDENAWKAAVGFSYSY